ncbi:MAG: thiamine-phosphate pyrophosphorylase, partial [Solirubrobacterales bacterium]|nr:thiamine-phosphate pyrophosphorylase [Solirubrobacterales bacterium]
DGVHLAASDPPFPAASRLVGRSCHTDDELDRAGREGASYATLSPVFASVSKPGYTPAAAAAPLPRLARRPGRPPVLALGGVTTAGVGPCLAAGAWGVAVLGAVMGALDPGAATSAFLDALERAQSEVAP